MKIIKYMIVVAACAAVVVSCDKESNDFLRDNTKATGVGYAPVSTNALLDLNNNNGTLSTNVNLPTLYTKGTVIKTELQYMSQSPVKEINLYNTVGKNARTKVGSWPWVSSFSTRKGLDTLLVPYTVPAPVLTTDSLIRLDYEILNNNNLNAVRTIYIKLK